MMVDEINALVRQSLAPRRSPTAAELRSRLPGLAKALAARGHLYPGEAIDAVMRQALARVVELEMRERLAETLSRGAPHVVPSHRRAADFFARHVDDS